MCSAPGCDRPIFIKKLALCNRCYQRHWRALHPGYFTRFHRRKNGLRYQRKAANAGLRLWARATAAGS